MPFASGYSSAEAQLLMEQCGFTYIDGSPLPGESVAAHEARQLRDINAALAGSAHPSWQVVWGPGLSNDRANMLYVAGDKNSSQLSVVIRGTDWSFWLDWLQDVGSLLPQVPFTALVPSTSAANPKIALGTNVGLQQLVAIQAATSAGAQLDLLTFLRQAGASASVFVTGHSLGGCLASVLAPWLAAQLGSTSQLKVYTFAAPSAGNADFADYYNRLFIDPASTASTAFRVYNDLDVVPNSWATLPVIETYYNPAPHCTDEIKAIISKAVSIVGTQYQQVGRPEQGSAVALPGRVFSQTVPSLSLDPAGDIQFFHQLQHQHGTATYLSLLGAIGAPPSVAKLRAIRAKLLP